MNKIIAFTLRQQFAVKSFRLFTVIVALLLFTVPAAVIPTIDYFTTKKESESAETHGEIHCIFVTADLPGMDFSYLESTGIPNYTDVPFKLCQNFDQAVALSAQEPFSLILSIEIVEETYFYDGAVLPGSMCTKEDASALAYTASSCSELLVMRAMGSSVTQMEAAFTAITVSAAQPQPTDSEDAVAEASELWKTILPIVNLFAVYFLLLIYGQRVAGCILLEKTSKLMDVFLLSVKPTKLVFGKLLANWLAAMMQNVLWVLCGFGGFAVGIGMVKAVHPQTDLILIQTLDYLRTASAAFAPVSVIAAVAIIGAGFLMYCALSAIGGSLAGKTEDLSSANSIFTLILVISYFIVLKAGLLDGTLSEGTVIWDYIPFTAVMITPARVVTGSLSVVQGCICLAGMLAFAGLFTWLSGKVYRITAVYKGNLSLKPWKLLPVLLSQNKKESEHR